MANPWRTACPDWRDRLLNQRSLVPELPLFQDEADVAEDAFRWLRIADIAGTPQVGDVAGEWVFPIVRAIFGSLDREANRRKIREFFLLVSKKNWKTGLGSAVMLTALLMNQRPEAEMTLIAPTKDIADRAFKNVAGSIRLDQVLTKLFHIARHTRTITHRQNGATLQVKAADTDVITGVRSTVTLLDETHVFSEKSNAADIFVEIRGALAARPDGFLVQITTQSKRPPAGVFRQELQNARDVRDGKLDLPLLPVLYEYPREILVTEEWRRNEALWPLVNPNLGLSVDLPFLRDELLKAEREGTNALTLFASQHFNVEIGVALGSDRWIGSDFWQRATEPGLTREAILERSDVVVIGLDGGGLDDLYGLALLGRDAVSKCWLLWSHAWCHTGVLERRRSIAPRLADFARAGELSIVTDELEDIEQIVGIVREVQVAGLLAAVAVDPAGIGALVDALDGIGISQDEHNLVGVSQGYRLMSAIKTSERRLANGTLRHGGAALMAWSVGNLRIEPMATAIRATKQHAGDAKIDPVIAMFNAVDVMSLNPAPKGTKSIYETMSDAVAEHLGLQGAAIPSQMPARGRDSTLDSVGIEAKWRYVGGAEKGIDLDILCDPRHRRFAEMRERFEAALAASIPDDDE